MSPAVRPAPLPFCVEKATGLPQPAASAAAIGQLLTAPVAAVSRPLPNTRAFALASDLNANDLKSAGWGALFGASVSDEIRTALAPLLERRRREAGARFQCFDGPRCCRPDQSAREWVAEYGGDFHAPDPRDGVPFYIMLVADPAEIGFEFQYDLDLNYAVGRLWFDRVDDFARYARSVDEQEAAATPQRPRRIGLVATRHQGDAATQMLHDLVAVPLRDGAGGRRPIGADQSIEQTVLLGDAATKRGVLDLLRQGGGAPAILFTGSHGLGVDRGDPAQLAEQGAMVCAEWGGEGQGAVAADQVVAGRDIPADAQVAGMIHFMFACYGAGCPRWDNFTRLERAPAEIADRPFVAALPQALLAHPGGSALAVIAHVERAWAYSFLDEFGLPRIALFRDILTELCTGARVGMAVDRANGYWAAHSTRLAELQLQARNDPDIDEDMLGALWTARDDARNIVVLGDPAVRAML